MAAAAPARIVQPVSPPRKTASFWRTPALWIAVALVLIAILAASRLSYRFGANETSDSAVYLSSADSPIHGIQLTTNVGEPAGTPLTHYPPLYPLLLAGARATGVSFLHAAVALDVLAYLCTAFGVYWFLVRAEKPWWAALAVLLLVCAGPVYYADSIVGPDGPAIALMILALCLASEYLRKGELRILVFCGVTLAAALLLRYVCAAFIGAACVAVFCGERADWRGKVRSALLLGAIASAPLALVLVVNRLLAGSATDRSAHIHLVKASTLGDLADTLSAVFLPYQLPGWFRCALLGAAAVLVIRAAFSRQRLGQSVRVAALFLGCYLVFLLVSMSLFDAATPFDDRILAPAVALICILTALLVGMAWEGSSRIGRVATALVLLAGVSVEAAHARAVLKISAQAWSAEHLRGEYSAILPLVQRLPKSAAIYTNVPFELYLVSGRNARTLPRVIGYTDLTPKSPQEISASVSEMQDQVRSTGGLIIYQLRTPTLWDAGLITQRELKEKLPTLVQVDGQRGFAVYQIPAAAR
jgi:4-amino-4-deoxy-L-arabinose transferase-like glycosyltransferase